MTDEERLRAWEKELARSADPNGRLAAAINVSGVLVMLDRATEALAVLDRFTPRAPQLHLMAAWLNNRAYCLVMVGRAEEGLANAQEAALIVDGATPYGGMLAGCIEGTHAIALLHLGRLEEAERGLLDALAIGRHAAEAEADEDGQVARNERALSAERWYWLAEVARRQGQSDEARRRYQRAAGGSGRFADRARAELDR